MKKNGLPPVAGAPVACPNCQSMVAGEYCPSCGQQRIHANDLDLRHALHALVHEMIHLDGRLWRTLFLFLRRPGQLTVDFLQGRRNRHIHPLRLFIFFSALYYFFGVHFGFGLKTVASFSPRTAQRFTVLAQKNNQSLAAYLDQLEVTAQSRLKAVHIASVLLTGLVLWGLYRRRSRRFLHHQIMAVHLKSFSFIVGMLLLPGWWLKGPVLALSIAEFALVSVYYAFALRRVYGCSWASALGSLQILLLADLIPAAAMWFTVFL